MIGLDDKTSIERAMVDLLRLIISMHRAACDHVGILEDTVDFRKRMSDLRRMLSRALDKRLEKLGLEGGECGADYYLIDEEIVPREITVGLLRPSAVTRRLCETCQRVLSQHAECDFWISFELVFDDARYYGRDERLIIRADRIVVDLNMHRLKSEFSDEFDWLRE